MFKKIKKEVERTKKNVEQEAHRIEKNQIRPLAQQLGLADKNKNSSPETKKEIELEIKTNTLSELAEAAKSGDINRVENLLTQDPSLIDAHLPCQNPDEYCTALHYAAQNDHVQLIQKLVAAGADINAGDHVNNTPLNTAVQKGKIAAVKKLLELNASPNIINEDANSPLYFAIASNNPEISLALLDSDKLTNFDINEKGKIINAAEFAQLNNQPDIAKKITDVSEKLALKEKIIELKIKMNKLTLENKELKKTKVNTIEALINNSSIYTNPVANQTSIDPNKNEVNSSYRSPSPPPKI